MPSTQETFESFGCDQRSRVQRITELRGAWLPSLSLTPKQWLKTEAVLFSINCYMNVKKKKKKREGLNTPRSMNSSPLSEMEFHFQDLPMTLNYSGCTPQGTEERWKTRQHVVRLSICNFNCFQMLLGTELSTSIQNRHQCILIDNLVTISGQSVRSQNQTKKSKRKQNITEWDRKVFY